MLPQLPPALHLFAIFTFKIRPTDVKHSLYQHSVRSGGLQEGSGSRGWWHSKLCSMAADCSTRQKEMHGPARVPGGGVGTAVSSRGTDLCKGVWHGGWKSSASEVRRREQR